MNKFVFFGTILLTACMPTSGQQGEVSSTSPVVEPTATGIAPMSVTATVKSTYTPIPTSSPTPVPKRYFTEEFDSPLTYWSTIYASGGSDRVEVLNENSSLIFELYNSNAWLYAIYGAYQYDSVHVETRVGSRGSDISDMGLLCHYDEQDGWYEFNISNDGTYRVLFGQWLAEEIARYIPILNDKSERIQTGNSINEIGLDCYENIVQLYINGKLIRKLNVEHVGLTGGKVGLSLASFEEVPVIINFDWVKVSQVKIP